MLLLQIIKFEKKVGLELSQQQGGTTENINWHSQLVGLQIDALLLPLGCSRRCVEGSAQFRAVRLPDVPTRHAGATPQPEWNCIVVDDSCSA
ncbi:unnamed protein product [Amoebophrya sp. A25]|nr:unnamed protein product [Amoebophrya sp. A25]|eukprot:GSA25T00015146001.1